MWISGRAPGRELEVALASRLRWLELARRSPEIGLRTCGSLLLARSPEEVALLEVACAQPDASARGLSLVTAEEGATPQSRARRELRLRAPLRVRRRHRAAPHPAGAARVGRRLRAVRPSSPGAPSSASTKPRCAITSATCTPAISCSSAPVPRSSSTAPTASRPRSCADQAADGRDGPRPYAARDRCGQRRLDALLPRSRLPARDLLGAPDPAVERYEAQLLLAPRRRRDHDRRHARIRRAGRVRLRRRGPRLPRARGGGAFGGPPPPIARRWEGAYLRRCDGRDSVWREEVQPGVVAVAGTGGMGVTGSQHLALETLDALDL